MFAKVKSNKVLKSFFACLTATAGTKGNKGTNEFGPKISATRPAADGSRKPYKPLCSDAFAIDELGGSGDGAEAHSCIDTRTKSRGKELCNTRGTRITCSEGAAAFKVLGQKKMGAGK